MARRLSQKKIKDNIIIGRKAIKLYKKGYNLREIGKLFNKSHEFIRLEILKIDPQFFD